MVFMLTIFSSQGIASRIKDSIKEVNSLLEFYYSVGSLILIKVIGILILDVQECVWSYLLGSCNILLSKQFNLHLFFFFFLFCITSSCLISLSCRVRLLKVKYFLAMLMEFSDPSRLISTCIPRFYTFLTFCDHLRVSLGVLYTKRTSFLNDWFDV